MEKERQHEKPDIRAEPKQLQSAALARSYTLKPLKRLQERLKTYKPHNTNLKIPNIENLKP